MYRKGYYLADGYVAFLLLTCFDTRTVVIGQLICFSAPSLARLVVVLGADWSTDPGADMYYLVSLQ